MIHIEKRVVRKLSSKNVMAPVGAEPTLSEVFHENTKLGRLDARAYGTAIGRLSRSPSARRLFAHPFKVYSLMDHEELPEAVPRSPLEKTIAERCSVRSYADRGLGRDELARLLRFSYGVIDPRGGRRPVPSGGALYPLELYLLTRRVEAMEPGVFHYDPEHHRLDAVSRRLDWTAVDDCVWLQDVDRDSIAAVVVIAAYFRRMTVKYQDRGYRMVMMEAGAVAQNLGLLATSMGLGACLLGGFYDDTLSGLLEIDGVFEAPLLPVVLGRSRQGAGGGVAGEVG